MRFLNADKVFNGKIFLPEHSVLVLDRANRLTDIISKDEVEENRVEKYSGILTPGFVNSHCHLELSHLKDLIPRHTGLPEFARQVILSRDIKSSEEKAEHMLAADRAMWENGIVAVGDVSNGSESFSQKAASNIFYHTFVELVGLQPKNAETIFETGLVLLRRLKAGGLSGSLAAHAPYSTSKDLISKIARYNQVQGAPLSIHNQESEEETNFFTGQKNNFEKLYQFLGLDTSWFKSPGMSSLQYYAEVLSRDTASLLVHNTMTSRTDLIATAGNPIYWCFCPEANQYIEGRLPEFEIFRGLAENICIGTDSLASNGQLDLIKEIRHLTSRSSLFSIDSLLRALTYNGAMALGISEEFGQLRTSKNAGLNLIEFKNSELHFLRKIC